MINEKIQYKGYEIEIIQDIDAESPRDRRGDYLGRMTCFHSKYKLGDDHDLTIEQVKDLIKRKDIISLPLYLYDHSGITISTAPFPCRWDSGQVGWIYTSKEMLGVKRITSKRYNEVLSILKDEVKEYDQYLTGKVYGFKVYKDGEEIEIDWDCYGEEYALERAKTLIDDRIEGEQNAHT